MHKNLYASTKNDFSINVPETKVIQLLPIFISPCQTEKFLIFLQKCLIEMRKEKEKETANSLQANAWIDERLAKILRDYVPSFPL